MAREHKHTPFLPPQVKGWCPGLFAPMQAKDGWLVRIRPAFSRLSAEQALCIANEAEQHGNGTITLTNRANLQLRGFSVEQAHLFPARMREAGLGLPDARQEKRQALQFSPLAGLDPACAPDTLECTQALREALLHTQSLSALPDKFGFAVDGGGLWPLGTMQADCVLLADVQPGLWCVQCGTAKSMPLSVVGAVKLAVQLAQQFVTLQCKKRPLRKPDVGQELFAACNMPWRACVAGAPLLPPVTVGALLPHVYGLGVPLGSLTPPMLRACAYAAQQGDGWVRLTARHSVILAGQHAMPKPEGFATNPADARLRIYACSGVAGCAQAHTDTPAQAMSLARIMPAQGCVHVSGCAKGCAHPNAAALTVVPDLQGYALVRNGAAGDDPTCQVPDFAAVRAFVQAWATKPQGRETSSVDKGPQ